ncbi:MAG: hypothetical protein GX371_01730 [Bacteroidales bacterium]|nr:hypothetical protein [Bacteroidales bacterium]
MEKKYRADNGLGNFFWGIMAVVLLGILVYRVVHKESLWTVGLYFAFTVVFILSVTIKEYAITDQNFLEIRFVLKLFSRNRRIAIGDMVGLKREKKNQLRIDKVRGFEVIRVKEKDMEALIAELRERNPRIRMPERED